MIINFRCKGTKKYAHTQASEHILLKKIDLIYHIITLPLTGSLLISEQVGVIIEKAKPYFNKICECSCSMGCVGWQ